MSRRFGRHPSQPTPQLLENTERRREPRKQVDARVQRPSGQNRSTGLSLIEPSEEPSAGTRERPDEAKAYRIKGRRKHGHMHETEGSSLRSISDRESPPRYEAFPQETTEENLFRKRRLHERLKKNRDNSRYPEARDTRRGRSRHLGLQQHDQGTTN